MSRSAPVTTSTLPVAPGTSVVTPMYTSVGFNAGDYVYQYGANLVGWPKGATTNMGPENTSIAGATYTGYKQVSDSRAVSYGPFTDQITYSGTTNTAGQIIVSPTTLSGATYASGDSRCAVLTDGRVAYAYRTGANTLTTAIYSAAGVLQGGTTTLSTQFYVSRRTFTMCALSDGGFIVGWYDASAGDMRYSRLNSSNSATVNNVQVNGAGTASFQVAATQNYYAFSWHTSDGSASAVLRVYSMSTSTQVGTYNSSAVSAVYATACAGTNSDTFYLVAGDLTSNTNIIQHVSSSAGALGSNTAFSTYSNGFPYVGCGSTASSTYPGAYAAMFLLNNVAGQASIVRVYATTATTPTAIGTNYTLPSYGGTSASISSTNNGGCVLVYRNTSSGNLLFYTYNSATALITNGTLVSGSTGDFTLGVSAFPGGSFAFAYSAVTTLYSSFGSAYSATYTNGVTSLTSGNSYTPSNGYYVLGISLTTAAAGSTGMVATNGSANLAASYPNVTSNILFDSTGTAFTARSAINAQRGNVIGTNVTLRGLE